MSLLENLFDDDDYRVSPWTLGAAGALVLFIALGTTGGLFFRNSFSRQASTDGGSATGSWAQRDDNYSSAKQEPALDAPPSDNAKAPGTESATQSPSSPTGAAGSPGAAGSAGTSGSSGLAPATSEVSSGTTNTSTGSSVDAPTTPITPAKPAWDSAAFVATARRDGSILLVGLVPSETDKQRFAQAFRDKLPLGSLLINRLEVDPTISLDNSELEIDGQARLVLFDVLRTLAKTGVGDAKVTITTSFQLVRPSLLETSLNVLFAAEPIQFPKGSAVISEASYATIDSATNFLFRDKIGKILLEGHTDNTGTPEANLALSAARAQAVRQALIDNGVSPTRLTTVGKGQSQPISENETDEGKQRNRRVEAVLLEEEEDQPTSLTETLA